MTLGKENKKNILLVAITRLGDMLQASPMIIGLKEEHPQAKITVLIDKTFSNVCAGIPGIDEVYEIDLSYVSRCIQREKEGIIDAFRYVENMAKELKSRNFDMCINMASAGYTAMLLKILDVKESRGWSADEEGFRLITNPWSMLFAAFVYHSNRDFNGLNLVDIMRCSAGVTEHPRKLQYNFPPEASEAIESFFREKKLTGFGPLICVQAGASQEKRQWSPAKFAYLTRLLVEKLDARVVYTGAKSEIGIVDAIEKCYNHTNAVSAIGSTNLNSLAALLSKADLLVTGDTGPMHMSVAVGTPVVALFLASALCFETGPYSEGNIVLQPQITCNPCNPNFPCARPDCHDQISPELVYSMVELRLKNSIEQLKQVRLPASIADPRTIAIYLTTFDEDVFLRFDQLNGVSERRGQKPGYFDAARNSYRELWKQEFGAATAKDFWNGKDEELFARGSREISALNDIIQCSKTGENLTEELQRLIADERSDPNLLGQTLRNVNKIDGDLEEIGLSNPIVGVLIRMFIMGKENIRGEDPLLLASQMGGLYASLGRRAKKFGQFFAYYQDRLSC